MTPFSFFRENYILYYEEIKERKVYLYDTYNIINYCSFNNNSGFSICGISRRCRILIGVWRCDCICIGDCRNY